MRNPAYQSGAKGRPIPCGPRRRGIPRVGARSQSNLSTGYHPQFGRWRGILFLSAAFMATSSFADGTASYSYRQVNWDALGQEILYEGQFDPVPAPINETKQTSNSQLVFAASGVQVDPISLTSRAALQVEANQQGTEEAWISIEARTTAEASLVDLATVEGAGGVSAGIVRFHWVVTGASILELDTTGGNFVGVEQLSTGAVLRSSVPGSEGILIEELHDFPDSSSFNQQWSETYPAASGALLFEVPWQAGQELPVFFDLTTTSQMQISNQDAAGFLAALDVDFGNTARILGVDLLDSSNTPIPSARLVSRSGFVYPAVPEPNGCLLLLIGGALVRMRRLGRRRVDTRRFPER